MRPAAAQRLVAAGEFVSRITGGSDKLARKLKFEHPWSKAPAMPRSVSGDAEETAPFRG